MAEKKRFVLVVLYVGFKPFQQVDIIDCKKIWTKRTVCDVTHRLSEERVVYGGYGRRHTGKS